MATWEEEFLEGDEDSPSYSPTAPDPTFGQTIFNVLGNLNEARKAIPEPPDILVDTVDWFYKNHPVGKLDQAVDYGAGEISKGISQQDFPGSDIVGPAAGIAFSIAAPGGLAGKATAASQISKSFNRINKLKKAKKVVNKIDWFSPSSGQLQHAFATAGVPNSIFYKGVNLSDDANLSKNFFEARGLDSFRQRNIKARQERGWANADNLKTKTPDPSWQLPKNQLEDLEELASDWAREQADLMRQAGKSEKDITKTLKKRLTKEWTDSGIELDEELFRFGQGNMEEVLQPGSTSRLKLKTRKHIDARALGSDPTQDPAVQQFFKRAHKQGALDPEFTLESYGKYVKEGAAWSDRMTVDMAKHFGGSKAKQTAISDWTMKSGALDKEHAWSIALKGSNDFLSQFYGSRMLNRSQGKLNSFTREVMNILGAPSNNLESATNWAAEQMARKSKKTFYNPAQELMPSDWLRVQDAFARVPPGASKHIQEEVAMKVLREREIITAWAKSDLPKRPKDIKVLQAYMEKIWEIDVPKSKLILDRTIGEQAFKKVMKEMYRIKPHKGVKNKGRLARNQYARHEGYSIAQPGAKFDPEMGRVKSKIEVRGTKVPDKRKFIDLGRDELKVLPRDEAAQRYEYIKSTLDRLDELDTTSNPFGLSEMQDRL
jgi:hypothetical protein